MVMMPIKEKMVKIHEHKQLGANIEALSKIKKDRVTFIEPLQDFALQMSLEVVASHIEVKNILKISSERAKDYISAKSLEEVLEKEQRVKVLREAVKGKVSQLRVPT